MRYDQHQLCAGCPFRQDVQSHVTMDSMYQTLANLISSNVRGYEVACDSDPEQHCVGALLFLEVKYQRRSNAMNRAIQFGHYVPERLTGAELVHSNVRSLLHACSRWPEKRT